MTTAIPPAPPTVLSTTTGGGAPVTVAVVSDAGAALQLVEGALVEASAEARPSGGVLNVQTADGPLQLKAQGAPLPPIPPGAKLLLQMLGNDGVAQLRLLAVNGRPLGGAVLPGGVTMAGLLAPGAPSAGGAGPSVPANPAATLAGPAGAAGAAPTAPLGLTATLIRPALAAGGALLPSGPQLGALTAGLPADLPGGSRLTVRIAGIAAPALPVAGEPAVPQPGAPTPPAMPGQVARPHAAGFGAPSASNPTGLTVSPPLLPAGPGGPPAVPANLLSGVVTAQSPGGHAVVQTPIGTLTLPVHADLPTGTPLTLEVVGKPLPPPAAASSSPAPSGLGPDGWPALSQAIDTLAAGSQAQELEQLMRVMPQAGPRLAASMAMFAGALRSGEMRALLPEGTVRGLEKSGRKDLAERLKADLETLSEEAGRPVGGGEWRVYPMPFLNGGLVEPVRLFVRRADGDEASARRSGANGNDQRFILDFNLSRLGRLQMDGLVRREDKLFDLIIRTGEPLGAEVRRDILGIFTNASELVGTKGSVSFQAGGRWVEFPPTPPEPTRIEV